MSNLFKYCFFLIIVLLGSNCKKPEKVVYIIKGTITDSTTGNPVNNVSLELSAKKLSSGTFNNNFQALSSSSTNASGYFEFNIEKESFNALKLAFEKDLYIFQEEEINPDDIDPSSGIDVSRVLDPLAYAELHLRNASPMNENDKIEFRYTSAYFPQCACCNNSVKTIVGSAIDTVITCPLVGNTQLDYLYTVTKGGTTSPAAIGTVFVNSFDTQIIELDY